MHPSQLSTPRCPHSLNRSIRHAKSHQKHKRQRTALIGNEKRVPAILVCELDIGSAFTQALDRAKVRHLYGNVKRRSAVVISFVHVQLEFKKLINNVGVVSLSGQKQRVAPVPIFDFFTKRKKNKEKVSGKLNYSWSSDVLGLELLRKSSSRTAPWPFHAAARSGVQPNSCSFVSTFAESSNSLWQISV